jgi:hypothetical protein
VQIKWGFVRRRAKIKGEKEVVVKLGSVKDSVPETQQQMTTSRSSTNNLASRCDIYIQ